jgi:hypothetical protein
MSRSANVPTFIDLVLSGRARISDIEDYIEEWHNLPEDAPGVRLQVYEYLGMTWEEYRLWAERNESLRFIVAARRAKQPVEKVLEQTKLAGAAARSQEHSEAANVLQWLADRGRIETRQS